MIKINAKFLPFIFQTQSPGQPPSHCGVMVEDKSSRGSLCSASSLGSFPLGAVQAHDSSRVRTCGRWWTGAGSDV